MLIAAIVPAIMFLLPPKIEAASSMKMKMLHLHVMAMSPTSPDTVIVPDLKPGDPCPSCRGKGQVGDGTTMKDCLKCDGTGKVLSSDQYEEAFDKQFQARYGGLIDVPLTRLKDQFVNDFFAKTDLSYEKIGRVSNEIIALADFSREIRKIAPRFGITQASHRPQGECTVCDEYDRQHAGTTVMTPVFTYRSIEKGSGKIRYVARGPRAVARGGVRFAARGARFAGRGIRFASRGARFAFRGARAAGRFAARGSCCG